MSPAYFPPHFPFVLPYTGRHFGRENTDHNAPSPVLPSGVQKITKVGSDGGGGNEAIDQAMLAGIRGISGTVDPNEDYAYSTVGRVSLGLKQQFDAGNLPSTLANWPSEPGAYTTATKANGDCVVIDFRNMKPYVKFVEDYPYSKMCPI